MVAKLEAQIAQFIWGEENPGEYQLQEDRIAKLEARIKTVKNIRQRGDFMATKDVLAALEAG
jgi:hypothetical protein